MPTNVTLPAPAAIFDNGVPAAPVALAAEAGHTFTAGAGNTLTWPNNGLTLIHFHITTAGADTIPGLLSANNVTVTFPSIGEFVLGPFDPFVYGFSIVMTTVNNAGSALLYLVPLRFPNGEHNPFETSSAAIDY